MAYPFEDLSVFFDDFAETIFWNRRPYQCLFSNTHDPLNFKGGGRSITAIVRQSDFAKVAQGDKVTFQKRHYSIEEIHPIQDGQIVKLLLEESAV